MPKIKVYGTPRCISTRRTWDFLEKNQKSFEKIDILSEPIPKWILSKLIVSSDIGTCVNHHHPLWAKLRNRRFTKASCIELLRKKPELIRRPILVKGKEVLQGYDEEELKKFIK